MSFCCCSFWKTSKAFTVTKDIEIQQTHYLNYSKPRLGRRIAKKKHFTNIHSMLVSRCPEEVRQDCKTSWEKAGNFFEHRGITEHVRQWFWWGAPLTTAYNILYFTFTTHFIILPSGSSKHFFGCIAGYPVILAQRASLETQPRWQAAVVVWVLAPPGAPQHMCLVSRVTNVNFQPHASDLQQIPNLYQEG